MYTKLNLGQSRRFVQNANNEYFGGRRPVIIDLILKDADTLPEFIELILNTNWVRLWCGRFTSHREKNVEMM